MTQKKLIMDIPDDIYTMLEETKQKMMMARAPIVRLAIKNYCDKALRNEN